MKPQSKSKTFPKGTDFGEVADFITKQIDTTEFDLGSLDREDDCELKAKYLITIVRYPEKSEIKEEK
jgi:hypothetical protein